MIYYPLFRGAVLEKHQVSMPLLGIELDESWAVQYALSHRIMKAVVAENDVFLL